MPTLCLPYTAAPLLTPTLSKMFLIFIFKFLMVATFYIFFNIECKKKLCALLTLYLLSAVDPAFLLSQGRLLPESVAG